MQTVKSVPSPLRIEAERTFARVAIRGLTIFAPPSEAALVQVLDGRHGILVAINAEKIAQLDPTIMALTSAHLGYPDGIGAVMAMRRKGVAGTRLPGADLWLAIVRRYAGRRSFYLVGSTDEVVATVATRLKASHPSARLWYRNGFFNDTEQDALVRDLRERRPDFVFVAMGSPRQEVLIARLFADVPAVYVGLGGSFDVYAGVQPRAPRWMQRAGLEWAFRFMRQPARLRRLPRYLKFVGFLASGRL